MLWRRFEYSNWTVGLGHLAILGVAAESQSRAGWAIALWLTGAISFCAWIGNVRRYQRISGMPTSLIASAAQGYVELHGRAEHLPEAPLRSRLRDRPCVWYQYRIEKKSGRNWTLVEQGRSDQPFLLIDRSGRCVVEPERAEVISSHVERWSEGNRRYRERWIPAGDPLYAIGEFASVGGRNAVLDEKEAIGRLLAEWKADPRRLAERFDLNADGEIDLDEWALARQQARREVASHFAEIRGQPPVHVMRRPDDGRLFIVSNLAPEQLARRYRIWKWVQAALFLTGIGAGTWLWLT
jgi:hypothetical protein